MSLIYTASWRYKDEVASKSLLEYSHKPSVKDIIADRQYWGRLSGSDGFLLIDVQYIGTFADIHLVGVIKVPTYLHNHYYVPAYVFFPMINKERILHQYEQYEDAASALTKSLEVYLGY